MARAKGKSRYTPGGGDVGASKAPPKSSKSYNKLVASFKGHVSKGVNEVRKSHSRKCGGSCVGTGPWGPC